MSNVNRKIDRKKKKPDKKEDILESWDEAKGVLETHLKMIDTYTAVVNDVKKSMTANDEANTDAYRKLDGMSSVLANSKEDGIRCKKEIADINDNLEYGIEMVEVGLRIGQIANNVVTVISDFTDFSASVYGIEVN